MTALRDIVFETDHYWVKRVPNGFEVYKTGLTHSTRVAVIGYTGDKGLQRAKQEIERREAASGPSKQHHSTKKSSIAHEDRWDDGPGAWQRGYDFAKASMLHEMRAEQREILNRVAKSASSSYDYGFLAAYQDAFGVPRSRAHATRKKSLARYWKVVRVDLITKEETLVAANFSTKADAEEAALDYLAGSKSTKYLFKPKAQGSRPIKGPRDTY